MTQPEPGDKKIRVGVIFGGRSGEHEVSLMSARSVIQALDPEKYAVTLIGISKDGRWLTGDVTAALESGRPAAARPATLLPDPQASGLMALNGAATGPTGLSRVTELDVVFPVLHGTYGEDGAMQGLLELAGLPYVGAGVLGSAVGMDKALFKAVMVAHGLPVSPWKLALKSEWQARPDGLLDEIEAALTYPLFTKPANLGSSVGVSKCRDRAELVAGLDEAGRYDRRIVIEQGVPARELEVSVLGNERPEASVIGEVRPRRDYYDYVAKYVSDDSELFIPAKIEPELAEQVRRLAIQAFKAIDAAGLARVDFLLDKETGRLYISELNTMPGFTQISMYAKLWQASGLSYAALLDRLITLALERHQTRSELETIYRPGSPTNEAQEDDGA
ncbi:MAG: D-alanine--D-alanine ligase family protein [Candidatus Promineifilaceae bacterium]